MLADKILTRLDNIRTTGENCWVARCPAHDDRTPSLAIREVEDKLLLHCFAGCSAHEVCSAAGIELSDLFPNKSRGGKRIHRPFPATDVLRCLSSEIAFLVVCASELAAGKTLDDETRDKLSRSASRFQSALSAGGIS